MSDSSVPPKWERQVENLTQRFGLSRTIVLDAMQRSNGHAGKAARILRQNSPQTEQVVQLADPLCSREQEAQRSHSQTLESQTGRENKSGPEQLKLQPDPEPEPEPEPELELQPEPDLPKLQPPPVQSEQDTKLERQPTAAMTLSVGSSDANKSPLGTLNSQFQLQVHQAVADTLAALGTATSELHVLHQECYAEESESLVKRGISVLEELSTVVQTQQAKLASMQSSDQEHVSLSLPSFCELWSALRELKELYAEAPDEAEFFAHSIREIWVSIGELVSDDDSHMEGIDASGGWRDADQELLLATAQGLQSEELWSSAIVVYSRLIHFAEAEESQPPQSSRQLYYNGRGMCYSRLGDMAAAAADIDTAGALVTSGALQLW